MPSLVRVVAFCSAVNADIAWAKEIPVYPGARKDSSRRRTPGLPRSGARRLPRPRAWERAVKVKGRYDGIESVERNERGCGQSLKSFLVASRYVVAVSSNICDLAVLNKVIDSMNLDMLPNR